MTLRLSAPSSITPVRRSARRSLRTWRSLFGLCGHGNFDLAAYDAYLGGTLEDPEFSQSDLDAALAALPEGSPSLA